jgi:hypothetical protein
MSKSIQIEGRSIIVRSGLVKTAVVRDEWYRDVEDSQALVKAVRQQTKADILTYLQRPSAARVEHDWYQEKFPVAMLPISSYKHWYEKQIDKSARRAVKRAEKAGVEVRLASFDDEFAKGIAAIYNETPIRQGKPFWHYGKNFETVKRENGTYLDKCDFIGAYYRDELIGFIKLVYLESFADPMQIISKVEHRDKSINNALLAKAVQLCEVRGIPRLFYGEWGRGGLLEFKRHNGFERLDLPRYYIPLTIKGKVMLKAKLHRGLVGILPVTLTEQLMRVRAIWYSSTLEEGIQRCLE